MMKELPRSVQKYKETKVFTEKTVPSGFLKNHNTMANVWGKLVVLKGTIRYIIENVEETFLLDINRFGVIEPQVLHRIEIVSEVEFYVEFYK